MGGLTLIAYLRDHCSTADEVLQEEITILDSTMWRGEIFSLQPHLSLAPCRNVGCTMVLWHVSISVVPSIVYILLLLTRYSCSLSKH